MGEYDHILFNKNFTVLNDFRMLQGAILRRLKFKHEIIKDSHENSELFYDENIQDTEEYIHAIDNIALLIKILDRYKCSCLKETDEVNYTYHVYNLHHEEKNAWLRITKEFIAENYKNPDEVQKQGAVQKKDRFIFIWYSGTSTPQESRIILKERDSCDPVFSYSKLLRDILIKKGMGIEVDLSLGFDKDKTNQGVKDFFETELIASLNTFDDTKRIFPEFSVLEKIVESFSNYFPKSEQRLTQDQLNNFLLDFYALGLNSTAFQSVNDSDKIIGTITKGEIKVGHDLPGSVLKSIQENESNDKIATIAKWRSMVEFVSQQAKLLVHYTRISNPLKILIVDDHYENMELQANVLKIWLYLNKESIESIKTLTDEKIDKAKDYDLIVIDLDYDGKQTGYEYLQKLREKSTDRHKPPYIIVLSRYENPAIIQKAFDMGAMIYSTKQNIGQLVLEIHKVLPLLLKYHSEKPIKEEDKHAAYASGFHNWTLLEKLPFTKRLELCTDIVQGKVFDSFVEKQEGNGNIGANVKNCLNSEDRLSAVKYDAEYRWIQKLPKAELHCHIGSCLGVSLIPKTSLLVLSRLYSNDKPDGIYNADRIMSIINFITPIVTDPFLDERGADLTNAEVIKITQRSLSSEWYNFKKAAIIYDVEQNCIQSLFKIVSDSMNLKANGKIPEEVLLNPADDTFEKHFHPLPKIMATDYFKYKKELRERGVTYDEVMLFFILFLALRDFLKTETRSNGLMAQIKKYILSISKTFNGTHPKNPQTLWNSRQIKENLAYFSSLFKDKAIHNFFKKLKHIERQNLTDGDQEKSLLSFLMSANSEQRCLKFEGRGLFHYLRGCEYGGSPHLQTPESIFLAAHHIVNEYAIPQNIRYLDLRCAVDGYNKFKLFTDIEPMEALLDSFSYWTRKEQLAQLVKEGSNSVKGMHVNIIITAKRHKSLKEFEDNIKLVQRYGIEKLEAEQAGKSKSNKSGNSSAALPENPYFENETQLVSFDIAGLEKNNRVGKFREQLQPLLKNCFAITVHAGEEDSHEAIWEAVYIAHSQRLGHALTLSENPSLLNLVRERGINIEMCPISNYLTNKKFKFKERTYPLRQYMEQSLSVSVNTDNPNVSESDLSMEYLFAAKLSGGISKWDILKLILNGFKSITIDKKERRKLLHDMNEEIFDILLNEGR